MLRDMNLPKGDLSKVAERTKELRGFLVLEGESLAKNSASEKIFLEILMKRLRKKMRGFKAQGIRLKSLNITID